LKDKGFITNHDANYLDKIKKLAESLYWFIRVVS
jgi:hypothetical protein